MAKHFHQLLQAGHFLFNFDTARFEPDHAVAAQYAADLQLLVPDGQVEQAGVQCVPVPFLHQQRRREHGVAIHQAIGRGTEEAVGNLPADIEASPLQRGQLNLIGLLQLVENAFQHLDRQTAELAIDHYLVGLFETGVEPHGHRRLRSGAHAGQHQQQPHMAQSEHCRLLACAPWRMQRV